jgi:hypothetical protein
MSLPLDAVLKALAWLQKLYVLSSAVVLGAAIGLPRPTLVWVAIALLFSAGMLARLRRQLREDAYEALRTEFYQKLKRPEEPQPTAPANGGAQEEASAPLQRD